MHPKNWIAAACGVLLCGASIAQDVHVLTPERYAIGAGEAANLRIESRQDGKASLIAWPTDRIRWYFVRGGGTQENRDSVEPMQPARQTVAQTIEQAGAAAVGVDLKPVIETWDKAAFEAFLSSQTTVSPPKNDNTPQADKKTVRVRRIETMRTIVLAATTSVDQTEPDSSTTVLSKTGQAVEIRLLGNPLAATIGADIPVKTYVRGDKLGKGRITATCLGDGSKQTLTADSGGTANFNLTRGGAWLIEFHHAEPAPAGSDFDWTILSATLTFEVNS